MARIASKSTAVLTALSTALSFVSPAAGASSSTTATATGACPTVLTPSYGAPVVGSGWIAQLVATDLKTPRSLLFDSKGALLVVQSGTGIQHITFNDHGGTCLTINKSQTLIANSALNHGIEMSTDGKTLYASSVSDVFAWSYDAETGSVGADPRRLVTNMSNSDHSTRTLLLSRSSPGNSTMLLVSRGSAENIDMATESISSGRSQIKAFDIADTQSLPYDYTSAGTLVGWGLRNSVGLAEEPITGGLYSVENSADQIQRQGSDIHEDDPGEELNLHGRLNDTADANSGTFRIGANYGYPNCFALWGTNVPNIGNMTVGSQFALDPNDTFSDATCAQNYVPPRLTFQAHTAPLDILFARDGSTAYVSFHGSWNRDDAVGYSLVSVPFSAGQPTDASNSTSAARSILSNADLSDCPGKCFRPVGLALDSTGRLFMASDATGEIYVLRQAEMTALGTATGSSGTLVTSTSTDTANIAGRSTRSRPGDGNLWLVFAAVALSLVGGFMVVAT